MPRATAPAKVSSSIPSKGPKGPAGKPRSAKKTNKAARSEKARGRLDAVGGKVRRWRPGTVALREMKKLQKSSKLLIQRAPFQRLVREIMRRHKANLSFKPSALEAIQEAAEAYMVHLFEGAVILQLHRNKKTLNWKDMNYVRRIRGELVA